MALDEAAYAPQSITVGGYSVKVHPETIGHFLFDGDCVIMSIKPYRKEKKQPENPQQKDSNKEKPEKIKALFVKIGGSIMLDESLAKEAFGEYFVSAMNARLGDVKNISLSGYLANNQVKLFNDEKMQFDGVNISDFKIKPCRIEGEWKTRVTFSMTIEVCEGVPANIVSVLSEFIGEVAPIFIHKSPNTDESEA